MRFLLRLSGEHDRLPLAELRAVLEGESIEHSLELCGRLVLLDAVVDEPSFLGRLAYTLCAGEVVGEGKTLDLLAGEVFDSMEDVLSFKVYASQDIAKKFGGLLDRLGWRVDLVNPDVGIDVVDFNGVYVSAVRLDFERTYEKRKPQYRPYFHPTSMHPKLARCLVNLSHVSRGDFVVDPFCGTGGILIEAGLMGMVVGGSDVDGRMVDGCLQNLRVYGLKADIKIGDAVDMSYKADAIVTDPPYGRASYTSEDVDLLYDRFLVSARGFLDVGSHLVLMLPSDKVFETELFDVVDWFDFRIHKSLTRRIWVLTAI
ncbi:MAG: TIGR01177 family methyltransferase [Candidatus Altiarchaeota archaeon]|nr:TIGR01177 family methyltransferase [Candidatus Altiarchaeota archaeon]